jgi:hypothetical protein
MTCEPIFGITEPRYPLRGATEFAALRYFALNGTDHRSHDEQNAAIAAYVRWRNARQDQLRRRLTDPHLTSHPAKAARQATRSCLGSRRAGAAGVSMSGDE